MPVLTAAIALLVSVASFVFAALVYAENRRLEREKHRAVALSATHTASLLLQEAMDVVGKVDAFFASAGIELDDETARLYTAYRLSVKDDHARITKAMSEVAYANLAVIECRALAAQATLVVYRTIDSRKTLLRILTDLRSGLPAATDRAALASGDGVPGPIPASAEASSRTRTTLEGLRSRRAAR